MKVTVTKQPKNSVELDIELDADAFQKYLARAVRRLGETVAVPGFRKGNVPEDMLVQKLGEKTILEEAAEEAAKDTYGQAIDEHTLTTVGPPKIEIMKLARGNPFHFRARAALLPKVTLGQLHSVKVSRKPITVTDEEIQKAIDDLRNYRRTETASLEPAKKGDKIEIDLELFRDGVPVDGGQSKNHPLVLGDGSYIPGFEDQLYGLRPGDAKEFTLTFPKDYRVKHLAGQPGQFRIKVTNLFHLHIPAADDAFAQSLGELKTMADLRAQLKKNLEQEKKDHEEQRLEGELLESIIRASQFEEIPDQLVEQEEEKMLDELEHDIQHRGMKVDDYLASIKKTRDELKKEFAKGAERRVKSALLLRELGQAQNVSVGREELEKERAELKERYAEDPAARSRLDDEEVTRYLATVISNRKVITKLKTDHVS